MTISEIKNILSQEDVPAEVLTEIMNDERAGVQHLFQSYVKKRT